MERSAVLQVVREQLARVLAVDIEGVPEEARLDEDLAADSLDLVETVEAVERALASHGLVVDLADAELMTLRTVGDAADRIAAAARPR